MASRERYFYVKCNQQWPWIDVNMTWLWRLRWKISSEGIVRYSFISTAKQENRFGIKKNYSMTMCINIKIKKCEKFTMMLPKYMIHYRYQTNLIKIISNFPIVFYITLELKLSVKTHFYFLKTHLFLFLYEFHLNILFTNLEKYVFSNLRLEINTIQIVMRTRILILIIRISYYTDRW